MSNSDNPFSAPTTVAEPVAKNPGPKRGVAHIVRRAKLPDPGSPAPAAQGSIKPAKGGKAHVISRQAPTHLAEDSIDQLITSPALKTPQKPEEPIPEPRGKRAGGGGAGQATVRGGGPLGTGSIDELTVEEGRPSPPKAMVALADKAQLEVAPIDDPNRGFLAVRSGSDLGRRVGLLEGRTTIGRGLDCDIVLTDPTISRQHAYVERRENVYVVCDLGSGNGTFVNERERQDEVLIVNGDTFRIGSSVICFEGPEAQDDANSTANWSSPAAVRGKKKGRRNNSAHDEESTVAGKARIAKMKSPPTHLDEPDLDPDPVTQAPTGVVEGGKVASEAPKRAPRKKTVPPPIPEDKKSVQDAALAALSSIVNTPTPEIVAVKQTGLGELPNQTVPPTPSPAILYPIGGPNSGPSSSPYPSAPPPMNLGQPPAAQMRQNSQPPPGAGPMGHGAPPMGGYPGGPGAPMQMRQGSQGQMPRGPSMPPPPMGGYHQPSGPQMQRPMLAGAAPDMMHSSYGGAGPAPRENGKLLIGFISVTLVLVVVGLLATVIGQMDKKEGEGQNSVANAAAADGGAAGMLEATDPTKGEPEATDPDKGEPEATDPTKGEPEATDPDKGEPEATDPTKGEPEATDPDKGEPEATDPTKGEPEATDPDKGEPEASERLALADLTAGKTTLGISTWGTDETFLSSTTDIKPTIEPIAPVESSPDAGTETETEPEPSPPPPTVVKVEKPEPKKPESKKPRVRTPKKPRVREPKPERKPDSNGSLEVRTAKDQARTMYKKRQFAAAARRLEKAADNLPDDEASISDKLVDLADGYRDVGELYDRAEKKADQNNPGGALKDYKKALAQDKKVAGGALATLLRLRIGQIAPRAAGSYMSTGNYAEAKKAAGDAKRNNNADAVAGVYRSLESKANKLIKKALRAKKSGDDDEAKDLLKQAIQVAPRKSDAESRARSELKRL